MPYEAINSEILPASVLINNFVKGIGPYTYDEYLTEIINECPYFLVKSNGTHYVHPPKEDHGEWDCVSPKYAVDFKLIASESRLQALNLFSQQVYVENGIVFYSVPKIRPSDSRYKPITATRIFAALRDLNYEDLEKIHCEKKPQEPALKDVQILLDTLKTDKNLFLFFPYNMYFADDRSFEEGLHIVLQGICSDFETCLRYRADLLPNRDTYFCFVYGKRFVINAWEKGTMKLIDIVSVQKSTLFMKLLSYGNPMSSGSLLK